MKVIRRQFLQIAGVAATASAAAAVGALAQAPPGRKRGGIFGRKASRRYERPMGKKRQHRTMAEKLRKYEVKGEGYEFIPAMMHLLRRYNAALPDRAKNEVDRRLARALDQIPKGKERLSEALKRDQAIPRELKRRAFSPKYLDLKLDQAIDVPEMTEIVTRARRLRNTSVRAIQAASISTGKLLGTEKGDCGCCCAATQPAGSEPTPTAPPNKYELTYANLYCVDESDPETWFSDSPYVVFAGLTEEMAEEGTPAYGVHTPVYEDVDDGDRRPSTGNAGLLLYARTGPKEIASSLLITTACFESDGGDPSETTEDLRTALTAAATTAASAGGVVGWVVAGGAVLAIGVTYLVDLLVGDDQIGNTIGLSYRGRCRFQDGIGKPLCVPSFAF
jgi:hypothetical protein